LSTPALFCVFKQLVSCFISFEVRVGLVAEEEEEDDEAAPLLLLLPPLLLLLPPPLLVLLPLLLFLAFAIIEKCPMLGAATSAKANADTISIVVLMFIATLASAIYYNSLHTLFYLLVK
jgi:hypothetical protein